MKMNADAMSEKYSLRTKSIIKRIESEKKRAASKRKEPKEKQKPPPLSKYRRKTANARERNRMREINDAFVTLQQAIPELPGADAEKLTKITILKLAVNYIDALAGVLDDDFNPTDVDGIRDLFCVDNAHLAQADNCVRPVVSSKSTPTKPTSSSGKGCKTIPSSKNSSKGSKPKSQQPTSKVDASKGKHAIPGKSPPKRPSKPKNKPKVCKTASVATSNGAYITLKNVALQTPAHKLGRYSNNEPLMMSMTVKRQRVEQTSVPRHIKLPRLEPVVPVMHTQPLFAFTPYGTDFSHVPAAIPGPDTPEPLAGATPSTFYRVPYTAPATIITTTDPLSVNNIMTFQDLDSPVVRNDVLLEFPRSGRYLSDSSSRDSAFSSDGSSPPSPFDGVTFIAPVSAPVPLGDTSPTFSISSSSGISGCGSTSDCESVLTAPVELGSLLGDEPFEEELDHLTSSFAEGDDTLNLFLANTTSNFICTDMDDC